MFTNKLVLPFQNLSKFLGNEKITLRKKQDRTLAADVQSVLSYRELINAKTNNVFDQTRILGIVAAAQGAESYLPYTIPKIIQQISAIGMMADIVIGLNNGFVCPSVVNSFSLLPNVQVIHLYTGEKVANNIPALIFDNLSCKGEQYLINNFEHNESQHRIFILHQKPGKFAAGKIRVLGDIYGSLLLKSINNGWIPPRILVNFDAESQFLVEDSDAPIDLESNGLELIIKQLHTCPNIDILGTRIKYAVYENATLNGFEVLLPNLKEQLPPIQWFLDMNHGRFSGFMYKPGGGTFGKSDVMISLLLVISQKYPGVRCEDTQVTVLANHANFIGDIFLDVISTNKTPSMTDMTLEQPAKKAWIEQMYRWTASTYGLKLLYGEHNVKMFADDGFPWFVLTNSFAFIKKVMGNEKINLYIIFKKLIFLTIAFLSSRQISKRSRKNPDVLQGCEAKAFW